jgi:hypothetical protein
MSWNMEWIKIFENYEIFKVITDMVAMYNSEITDSILNTVHLY